MGDRKMKILWKGNIFNPTGLATANREIVLALVKLGHEVQVSDIWHDKYDFCKGLEFLNQPLNGSKIDATIFADYPQYWQGGFGKLIGHFLHEGTVLFPDWPGELNKVEKLFVPSNSVRNLFLWNNVIKPIKVIPYGTKEIYHPTDNQNEEFVFLSVNSWTGNINDRKGTDLLIRAFDEEFKDEKVKLVLKIGTFWMKNDVEMYKKSILNILGHDNPNIVINSDYVPEKELVTYYQNSDCFVSPTKGEGFGMTILNAMASGLPVIVTKDKNSGHMDFCKNPSILWIESKEIEQGDPRFYFQGNMLAKPDFESLKKQMRFAFNHRELKIMAKNYSDEIREEYSWENCAKQIIKYIEEKDG